MKDETKKMIFGLGLIGEISAMSLFAFIFKKEKNKNAKNTIFVRTKENIIGEAISRAMDNNSSSNYKGKTKYYEDQINRFKLSNTYKEYVELCSEKLKFQKGIELMTVSDISDLYNSNNLDLFKHEFENSQIDLDNENYCCIDMIMNSDLEISILENYYSYQRDVLTNILESIKKKAMSVDNSNREKEHEMFIFFNEYVKNYNKYIELKLELYNQYTRSNKFKIVNSNNDLDINPSNAKEVSEKDFRIVSM